MSLDKCLFENVMKGGLDNWSNYSGPDWTGWYCGPSMTRDSEVLSISNYETALEMLGGEVEGEVEVRDVGHWACGWFKQIMVHKDSKQAKILAEILSCLENYPVLDDSDYSERESEAFASFAEQEQESLALAICTHLGFEDLAETKEMIDLAYLLNIECQHYFGSDSCVDLYEFREPDTRSWERFETCLKQIRSNGCEENEAYQLVMACLGLEV